MWNTWLHWTSIYTRVTEQNMAFSIPPHACFFLVKCPRSGMVKICCIRFNNYIWPDIFYSLMYVEHIDLCERNVRPRTQLFKNLKSATIKKKKASLFVKNALPMNLYFGPLTQSTNPMKQHLQGKSLHILLPICCKVKSDKTMQRF